MVSERERLLKLLGDVLDTLTTLDGLKVYPGQHIHNWPGAAGWPKDTVDVWALRYAVAREIERL